MTITTQTRPDAAIVDQIRRLRRKGFSVPGIARQVGMAAEDVARVLQEPHLLAQISRRAGK